MNAATPATALCNYCKLPVDDDQVMELWDGKLYCVSCIESTCPGLTEYAAQNEALEETIPTSAVSWRHFFKTALRWWICAIALFSPAFLYGVGQGLAVEAFISLPLVLMFSIIALFGGVFRWIPRTVRIEHGEVTLESPRTKIQCLLEECLWMRCRVSDSNDLFFLPNQSAVVLSIHLGGSKWMSAACNGSDATLKWWEAFFTLAGVEKTKPFSLPRIGLSMLGAGVLGGIVGYAVSIVTEEKIWIGALVFVGLIDGFVACLAPTAWARQRSGRPRRPDPYTWSALFAISAAVTVFGLGGLLGVLGCISVILVNALIGYGVGGYVRKHGVEK